MVESIEPAAHQPRPRPRPRSGDEEDHARREPVVVTRARLGGRATGAKAQSRGRSSQDLRDPTRFAGAPAGGWVSYMRTATMAAPTAVTPATTQIAVTNPKASARTPDNSAPTTKPASRHNR